MSIQNLQIVACRGGPSNRASREIPTRPSPRDGNHPTNPRAWRGGRGSCEGGRESGGVGEAARRGEEEEGGSGAERGCGFHQCLCLRGKQSPLGVIRPVPSQIRSRTHLFVSPNVEMKAKRCRHTSLPPGSDRIPICILYIRLSLMGCFLLKMGQKAIL
jgi:hypothetical protein